MNHKIFSFIKIHWHFIACALFFLILLARNPFSERTLIPNLEPYPDSFHYIEPALSFLSGHGFTIEREGRTIAPSVPPLYSFVFVPAFIINSDVRMFYFTNVVLAFWALAIFYVIVRTLFERRSLQLFLLVLYITHPVLIWFPTLAMAENLLLVLFLEAVLLLISPSKPRRALIAGCIAVAFYATKYASLPLSAIFPVLYIVKLFLEKREKKTLPLPRYFLRFGSSLLVTTILYLLYEFIGKGNNVIGNLWHVAMTVFAPPSGSSGPSAPNTDTGFFSLRFASRNIGVYTHWLIGDSLKILWKNVQILPKYLALPALLGLVVGFVNKKTRTASWAISGMLISTLAFLSVFYDYDGRYFFIAIPSLILGIGFFFAWIYQLFHKKSLWVSIVIIVLMAGYLALSAKAIKFQIALNLKYAETPCYYISVKTLSEYLHDHSQEYTDKPVVVTSLPPYLIDAYLHEPAQLLPLNTQQEFRTQLQKAWGDFDFDNMDGVYTRYLIEGRKVYLMKYGLGNEQYLHDSFDRVSEKFHATKVVDGCFDLCNLYELHLQ